jgi:hypothetical protein
MAISSSMVWEIRSAGSVTLNGGGGFKPGASGTDYSQQNSVQYALTGGTTSGISDTIAHSSASTDMVGNTCLLGGTNVTAGYYEIIAVVAGVSIQVDRNCTTGSGAAMTIKIGGATATIGSIGLSTNHVQPGNYVWIKGTFTGLLSDNIAMAGTASLPVTVEGYNTTRGDGYLGRSNNGSGPLITTNFPSLTYAGAQRINPSGSYIIIKYLTVITNNGTTAISVTGNNIIYGCSVVNNNTTSAAGGLNASAGGLVANCDVSLPSGVAGAIGVNITATGGKCICCRVSNAGGTGIVLTAGGVAIGNLVFSCGIGIFTNTTTTSGIIWSNTIANISGDGINIVTGTTAQSLIGMNMITDCGGYGVNMVSTSSPGQIIHNRFRDNTSGNVGNASAEVLALMLGNVTSGNGTTDYVNAAGGDYTLLLSSPAVAAGLLYPTSMGAYQRGGVPFVHPGMIGM